VRELIGRTGRKRDELGYVPLHGRENFQSAVVDLHDGRLLAILPFDPY
jgi:hypothetical protein